GVAVVTVAHRLSTALDANRVIVLDAGRVVEDGSPERLAARRGRFAALLELEAAGWDWRGVEPRQATPGPADGATWQRHCPHYCPKVQWTRASSVPYGGRV